MIKVICLFFTISCVAFAYVISSAASEKIHVTFINPGFSDVTNPTGGFWWNVSAFMNAAAEDLNIDLEILYSDRNHMQMKMLAKEVANRQKPPTYLIVVNEKLSADSMVQDADKAGIKTFLILNKFVADQADGMGSPREIFKNWIGSLIPDNESAGYQIAELLIEEALNGGATANDGKLHLLGYAGDHVTPASVDRVTGLKKAVSEFSNVDLKQVVSCNWSREEAKQKTPSLLSRYPQVGAIWGANDPIALGAMESVVAAKKQPGKDIFFGGLNWDAPGLDKVINGSLVTSVGGHFMTGGWALVMLYDYHHGKDFADEGVQQKRKIFNALHSKNINTYMDKLGDRNWNKIDFTKFSKVHNPDMKKYDFSLKTILNQL